MRSEGSREEAFLQFTKEASASTSCEQLFVLVSQFLSEHLRVELTNLVVVIPEQPISCVSYARMNSTAKVSVEVIPVDETALNRMISTGRFDSRASLADHAADHRDIASLHEAGLMSVLSIPIYGASGIWGGLSGARLTPDLFLEPDILILMGLASQITTHWDRCSPQSQELRQIHGKEDSITKDLELVEDLLEKSLDRLSHYMGYPLPQDIGLQDRLALHGEQVEELLTQLDTLKASLFSVAEHYGAVARRIIRVRDKADVHAFELAESLSGMRQRLADKGLQEEIVRVFLRFQNHDIQKQELNNLSETINLMLSYLSEGDTKLYDRLVNLPYVLDTLFPRDDIDVRDIPEAERSPAAEFF